jgi:hypothetical protein
MTMGKRGPQLNCWAAPISRRRLASGLAAHGVWRTWWKSSAALRQLMGSKVKREDSSMRTQTAAQVFMS